MDEDHKSLFSNSMRPLTVYLGESGRPHDTKRVDVLPPELDGEGRKIAVSISTAGVTIIDITKAGESREVWSIDYVDLPE